MKFTRRRREYYIVDTSAFESFKLVGKRTDPTLEDIPLLVKEMRACFESGYTRPRAKRLQQLQQLRKMIVENEDKILEVRWGQTMPYGENNRRGGCCYVTRPAEGSGLALKKRERDPPRCTTHPCHASSDRK
jgi:hypothetical protein